MKTGSFSRTSTKCQSCPKHNDCDNKRLEACAYLVPEKRPIAINIESGITEDITHDIAREIERSLRLGCAYPRR